jgi:hypothetical protein
MPLTTGRGADVFRGAIFFATFGGTFFATFDFLAFAPRRGVAFFGAAFLFLDFDALDASDCRVRLAMMTHPCTNSPNPS